MSDFLTSLAQRSSSSTNVVMPAPKARFQSDANTTNGFDSDQELNYGNESSTQETASDTNTSATEIRHPLPSIPLVKPDVRFHDNTQPIFHELHQSDEVRGENKNELPLTSTPTSVREVVRETRREVEVRTELSRNLEKELFASPLAPVPASQPATLVDPIVRAEVQWPTPTENVPHKTVSTFLQGPKEIKSVPPPAEVNQVTQVFEKTREPIVERITEIVPATSQQLSPPISLPKPTFQSTAITAPMATETVVNVTIGRIEIRAQVESKRTQRVQVQDNSNAESLREYLSRRST